MQYPQSYKNMRNAFGILKLISMGEDDIRAGQIKTQEEVFASIEELLKDKPS